MISGHLQVKKGYYYAVLSYCDDAGRRKSKWIATGLPEKNNKKKAESILIDERRNFIMPAPVVREDKGNPLFSYYMEKMWLPVIKGTVELSTYCSYEDHVVHIIVPYFKETGVHLKDLSPQDIQDFYSAQLKRVKASTVIHYHAAIHKALEHAVRMNLITYNPADRVDRPKKIPYKPTFYDVGQLQNLFTLTKDDPLWLLIRLTAFYGFRRSEVVGLKWSAISFENNRIEVDHTVTQIRMNGKKRLIQKDRAKNKSSIRSMPLVTTFKDDLILLKKHQDEMKMLCGNCYNHEFDEYIYVDDIGNLLKPDYVSGHFEWLLNANGLPKMRFHDLRHSCASLLLDCGVSMKQIQEWLGHSDFNTTANLYAHLQSESKMNAANTMASALKLDEIENDNREKAV